MYLFPELPGFIRKPQAHDFSTSGPRPLRATFTTPLKDHIHSAASRKLSYHFSTTAYNEGKRPELFPTVLNSKQYNLREWSFLILGTREEDNFK